MGFPKQLKDIVYELLQEPTLDTFRKFVHSQTGEHNSIDFKKGWTENVQDVNNIISVIKYNNTKLFFISTLSIN